MKIFTRRGRAGDIDRRRALGLITTTGLALLAWPRDTLASCRYRLSERLHLKGRLIIDAHCHVFNLSDLPVEQFLRRVQFKGKRGGLVEPAIRFVKRLQRRSVGFRVELRQIKSGRGRAAVAGLRTRAFQPGAHRPETNDESALQFALEKALTPAEDEAAGDREAQKAFADFLERKYNVSRTTDGTLVRSQTRGWKTDSFSDNEEDEASRTLDWGHLLTRSRARITSDMVHKFSPRGGLASVDLYTPAVVDFEFWLDERAPTSIPQQIHLLEEIMIQQQGRLHGFVPFCPWRQIDDEANGRKKTALHRVEDAIRHGGYIGVKLYPPMGFRPIGNSELKRADFPSHLAGKPYAADIGKRLDAALLELYKLCVELDTCIMVHTAPTQPAGPGFEARAHPKYWRRILKMPGLGKLRVNLAHFGGFELTTEEKIDFRDPKSWHHHVGKALIENENVYADLSHFDGLLTDGCDIFRANMIGFLRTFRGAEKKVIYGSDYSFISRERFHGRYLVAMSSWLIRKVAGKAATYDIMGPNAARFLGLYPGDANRTRLDAFYRDNDIAQPGWAKFIG